MSIANFHRWSFRTPVFLLLAFAGVVMLVRSSNATPYSESIPDQKVVAGAAVADTIPTPGKGKLSRRARILMEQQNEAKASGEVDTSFNELAAIRALPRDSSARIAQFQAVRRDPLVVDPLRPKTYSMYLPDPLQVRYHETLDTATWVYHLRRSVGTWNTKIPLDLTFAQYAKVRLKRTIRSNWEALAQAYTLTGQKQTGLSELFGKVTNIQIPVPKNPIFSIFGPNIISLHINGGVDVTAGFRNTKSDLIASDPLSQSRSEPEFKQDVQVTVSGEIGDKLKIDADWDTKRTFEYENQLRVKYTGYEDELIQSVEAGNVSLPLSSSFISSSQALFGIKAGFQFGPLRLTTIASQKKGEIKSLSVSGGAQPTPFTIRPSDYSKDHYFVDTSYINEYPKVFLDNPRDPDIYKQIRDIEVWVTKTTPTPVNGERDVVAYIDVPSVQANQDSLTRWQNRNAEISAVPGQIEVGRFIQLQQGPNADYTYNADAGIVSLNTAISPDQAIAVAYAIPAQNDLKKTVFIGNFGSRTTDTLRLVMKLIKPRNLDPSYTLAWQLMLKNRYLLGGRGIKQEGFDLHIGYDVSGQNPVQTVLNNVNLLQMFGLDRYTSSGGTGTDGKFDYLQNVTIDENRGELIFPTLEPFSAASIKQMLDALPGSNSQQDQSAADSFSFNALYDTTYTGAVNDVRNKFEIAGNFTPSVASSYNLGYNIVENSVEVWANGQKATPNVDYTVDYISGQVVIKNQALLVPGSNLQIKYEANDLFQLASKTLVGARGDLDVGRNSTLGFTIMNLNQQSLSDKVRLGEEPISNTILGVDGGTQFDMDFLTHALNWLPGVNTNAPSQFNVRGEAAYMLPDPNTRKSSIGGDNGSGMAYIDDFEGAKVQIPIGISWTSWTDASPPFFSSTLDDTTKLPRDGDGLLYLNPTTSLLTNGDIIPDDSKINFKAKASWYNFPFEYRAQQIWDPHRKSIPQDQTQETVLDFHFRPDQRGAYNYSMNMDSTLGNPEKTWGGIQQVLGTTSTNLLDQNISFIEMWVRIDKSQPTTKLNIDLGFISEAVIPDGKLHTEDGLRTGIPTGVLQPNDDVGLDGLNDAEERLTFAAFLSKYAGKYNGDPSGDDYAAPPLSAGLHADGGVVDPDIYANANGTDQNAKSLTGIQPNTEDLNRNNTLDRINNYFEYEISLDTTNAEFQKYVTGEGLNHWFQVRIPLNDFVRRIGDPAFTTIEGIRMWVTGAQSEVLFHIAEPNLVGNQWQQLVKNDSTFKVSTVSFEDNPGYDPPDGHLRTKDPTRPTETVLSNEQSLDLVVSNLADGESRQAIKQYPVKPLDVFSYKTMKMFIHGDERPGFAPRFIDTTNYDVEVFFRFGADSLNYYEYREPLHSGWAGNEMVIHFDELTAIKFARDSANAVSRSFPVANGPPGAVFRVLGQPTLTNIRYLAIGIKNPAGKGTPSYSGEAWFDELRLTDVDNARGGAYRFDTGLKLADLGNIAFSFMYRDPNFHGLEDHFGSRTTNSNWTLSANFAFDRLLPASWAGTSLAFSYSHVEGFTTPKYLPGTDVLVTEAAQRLTDALIVRGADPGAARASGDSMLVASQTFTMSESYALPTIKFMLPVDYWLVRETINRMTFGFTYNTSSQRSPTIESATTWGWNARFGYALTFSPENFLALSSGKGGGWWSGLKFYYTPRNFNFSASMNRSQSNEMDRGQLAPRPTSRTFAASRSMSFSWQFWDGGFVNLGADYQVDIQSNLTRLELDRFGRQRSFVDMLSDIFLSDRLVDFGTDQGYGQSISLRTKLTVPTFWDLNQIFTPNLSYASRYSWSYNNIQSADPRAQNLGKGAGVGTSLQFGLDVSVKTIANKIWSSQESPAASAVKDTTKGGVDVGKQLDKITRVLFKNTLFDFERFSIQFSQSNTIQNNGIMGRPGFANIFGRVPFIQSSTLENGPAFLYQLGLQSYPSGYIEFGPKSSFPFFTAYSVPGLRAPGGNLTDVFAQTNTVTMNTSRPLWEGATLSLNWKVSWAYNSNSSLTTDAFGVPTVQSQTISGNSDRSFMTFPPILFFKFFKVGVDQMYNLYQTMQLDPNDTRAPSEKIAQAFEDGFEAIPLSRKIFGAIAPRLNWSFHWDGLENFSLFKSFAQRVSLDNAYQSDYRRQWMITPDGSTVTQSQEITAGFSPLLGINVTFKNVGKGSLGGTFRYNVNYTYDLAPSSQNLTEAIVSNYNITLNYSRQGFQIPFFGLSLSNDIDMSFTYGLTSNSSKIYDFSQAVFNSSGNPLQGLDNITMEPRIRYTLSSRVTASVYYRYTKVKPGDGGSRIPGSTVNEGGLEVHVSIQ